MFKCMYSITQALQSANETRDLRIGVNILNEFPTMFRKHSVSISALQRQRLWTDNHINKIQTIQNDKL